MPDDIKEKTVESGMTDFIEGIGQVKVSTLEETNKTLLYMLEDLNEMMSTVSKSKKDWEDTVDSISDPLFIHDRELKIIRCNRAYKELSGSPNFKDIIGKPYFEVFPKMEAPFKMCMKAIEEEEEILVPAINRVFKVRYYPIKNEDNGLLYSVHIMEDITEAKRAADALKESETQYRTVFEQSPVGLLIIDPETMLPIEFNDTACRQLGYTREEFSRVSISDYEVVEMHEETRKHIEKLLRYGYDYFETRHRTKDGEIRNVLVSVKILIASGRKIIHTVLQDITEGRRAEERIRQEMEVTKHLLMIAEATAQLTELDDLLARVVHCVRQIMGCNISLSYLWDNETRRFIPCEETGLNLGLKSYFKAETIKSDIPFLKKAIETGFEVIEDITIDDVRLKDQGCGLFRLIKDLNRIITISITGKNGYRGILVCIYVGDGQPTRQFAEREKELVRGITYQVSIAMENTILYKSSINRTLELSRKIETIKVMHEIDKSILSTLNPQEILETAIIMISRIVSCDKATVVLADYEKKGFYYAAGFGVLSVQKGAFVPFKDTSTAEIVKTIRPQYIANLEEAGELLPIEKGLLDKGFLSHIRVPLTVKGNCIGVLSISAKRPAAFTPDDLSTLEKLSSQISVALENSRLLQDVEDLFISTIRALSNTIDAKSPWTNGHSERVTKTAIEIGKKMGLDKNDLKKIEIAGLLHDIGKIGTYETILNKPGKLTEEELNIMRQHPRKGADILAPIKQLREIIPPIKHHHEFYDGSGYPDGLKSEEIPLMARILAVADTADAMGADRPYRKGKSMEEIIAELERCSGTQFDPNVVEAFLKHIKM